MSLFRVRVGSASRLYRAQERSMYDGPPPTKAMLHAGIYEELKRVARRQEMTTYSGIGPLAGLDMESPADRDKIRRLLGMISTYEHQKGRPMLTAVVVH